MTLHLQFQITCKEESLLLFSNDPDDMKSWITALDSTIRFIKIQISLDVQVQCNLRFTWNTNILSVPGPGNIKKFPNAYMMFLSLVHYIQGNWITIVLLYENQAAIKLQWGEDHYGNKENWKNREINRYQMLEWKRFDG